MHASVDGARKRDATALNNIAHVATAKEEWQPDFLVASRVRRLDLNNTKVTWRGITPKSIKQWYWSKEDEPTDRQLSFLLSNGKLEIRASLAGGEIDKDFSSTNHNLAAFLVTVQRLSRFKDRVYEFGKIRMHNTWSNKVGISSRSKNDPVMVQYTGNLKDIWNALLPYVKQEDLDKAFDQLEQREKCYAFMKMRKTWHSA